MYRVGICDDDKNICRLLENTVKEWFLRHDYDVEFEIWYDGESCVNDLTKNIKLDILFLDIVLPGNDGVKVGQSIRETLKDMSVYIIYISQNVIFDKQLFHVHAYDFLEKPISENAVHMLLNELTVLTENNKKTFQYRKNGAIYTTAYGNIVYMCSNDKLIEIHMADGTVQTYRGKLSDTAQHLPEQFVAAGKSYVINVNFMVKQSYSQVILKDNTIINISQSYRKAFRQKICELVWR